ncbi:hypothetical protein CK203_062580 [Vitis vinifera]|uniref:Uncharacterized protein n=1 Tax=Vitis vinifera TaxID=29760 RepID=A0A438FQC3_VITVI|nr:hypothetical protein CK203_062580 [Vitis vinifera]
MHLNSGIIEGFDAMMVAPSSPGWANMFSMCFLDEDFDYGLLLDSGGGTDGVTLDDAYTDEMDMIGIGHILDVALQEPHFVCDLFGVSMLKMDGDDSITDVAIPNFTSVEGASDIMGPPISFDSMSGVGFLSVVEYPEWLANVVLIPKKDDKVRVCINYRDLNKASPKDDFPLPHIDMLVDSTGHAIWVEECKNHLSRAATTLFHDMMHKDFKFRLRLNPKKCTFKVTSRRLLGHIFSERGIEVDLEKMRAILDMPAPRTEREIRGFLDRLQYISHFIARLIDIFEPIFHLLRKN